MTEQTQALQQAKEALEKLAKYPSTRADEMSAAGMREIARAALAALATVSDASPSPVSVQPSDEQREKVMDAIAEALGGAMDCLRVWSAWGVGTMGPGDFASVAEDSDRLAEITDAAIKAILSTQPAQPVSDEQILEIAEQCKPGGSDNPYADPWLNGHFIAFARALLSTQSAVPQQEPASMTVAQEPKYGIRDGRLLNRASGEFIPADEPVFIFRARDVHAVNVLADYARNVSDADHAKAVWARVEDFKRFWNEHPDRMKQPDTAASHPQAVQTHDWYETDGNMADIVTRCAKCGVHKGSPAGNASCEVAAPQQEPVARDTNTLLQDIIEVESCLELREPEDQQAFRNIRDFIFATLDADEAAAQPQEAGQARELRNAALEEAARVCDEYEEITASEKDSALLVGKIDLSNAMSGEPRAARFIAEGIRNLKSQQPAPAAPVQPQEPFRECRHCGWECRPNDAQSKRSYPVQAAPSVPEVSPLDFSKPLEMMTGEPVKHVCADVIEYRCARVCVDQASGVVYSSPYIGMKIRNAAAPAPSVSADAGDALSSAVEDHCADLDRCAEALRDYPAFAATASEITKAASEFRAAIAAQSKESKGAGE